MWSFNHVSQAPRLNDVREERQRQWHTFLIEHNGHLTPTAMCTQTNTLAFKYSMNLRAAEDGSMLKTALSTALLEAPHLVTQLPVQPDPGD